MCPDRDQVARTPDWTKLERKRLDQTHRDRSSGATTCVRGDRLAGHRRKAAEGAVMLPPLRFSIMLGASALAK
jgi:hypothetical protein